jgi:hypothetical protein
MPNWCANVVIVSHADKSKLDEFRQAAVDNQTKASSDFMNVLCRKPADVGDNWYEWNVANWGTKWDVDVFVTEDTDESVTLSFDSAWAPPIEFFRHLTEQGYTVTGYYYESGMGFAGIYENGQNDEYALEGDADDVEATIPQELDEMFNIVGNIRDWEEENMDDEDPEGEQV